MISVQAANQRVQYNGYPSNNYYSPVSNIAQEYQSVQRQQKTDISYLIAVIIIAGGFLCAYMVNMHFPDCKDLSTELYGNKKLLTAILIMIYVVGCGAILCYMFPEYATALFCSLVTLETILDIISRTFNIYSKLSTR